MRINFISSVNFNARETIKQKVEENRKLFGSVEWNLGGAKAEAKSLAILQLDTEYEELETGAITAEEKLSTMPAVYEEKLKQQQSDIQSKTVILEQLEKQTKTNNNTIDKLKSSLSSNNSAISTNRALKETVAEEGRNLSDKVSEGKQQLKSLNSDLRVKKLTSGFKTALEVQKSLKELKRTQAKEFEEIGHAVEEATRISGGLIELQGMQKNGGMNRIKGYQSLKDDISKLFAPLAVESQGGKVKLPNGVLFYGPQGCGKTSFARAFAESTGCNIQYFRPSMNPEEEYNDLVSILEESKKNFNNTNKRTFILVDEFDAFASKNSQTGERLKNLTDQISEEYHATILATTNFPENIDQILLRDGRFHKFSVGLADDSDAAAIINYYANGAIENPKEMDSIIKIIMNKQEGKFSNSQIKSVILEELKNSLLTKQPLTYVNLKEAFSRAIPDVSSTAIARFKTQLQYVARI